MKGASRWNATPCAGCGEGTASQAQGVLLTWRYSATCSSTAAAAARWAGCSGPWRAALRLRLERRCAAGVIGWQNLFVLVALDDRRRSRAALATAAHARLGAHGDAPVRAPPSPSAT